MEGDDDDDVRGKNVNDKVFFFQAISQKLMAIVKLI